MSTALEIEPSKKVIQILVPSSAPAIKSQAYQILLQTGIAAAAAGAGVLAVAMPALAANLTVAMPPYLIPIVLGLVAVISRQLAVFSQNKTVTAVNTALNTDAIVDLRYVSPTKK